MAHCRLQVLALGASEVDVVPALEIQDFARFIGRRDFQTQAFDQGTRAFDLIGIGFGQLARAVPQRVFQPHAHIAAHCQRLRRYRHLVAAGAQHRPDVVIAEQAVGGALHVRHVFRVRANATEQTKHRLDQEGRLDQPALDEVGGSIEMANVIALNFKAGAVVGTAFQNVGDVFEGVSENTVVAVGR